MAYLPTNSTNTLLLANQEFTGEAVAVDKEYISVTCSFNSNVGGVLEFFHSIDGFAFSNYADIYDFTTNPGSHSIEVSVKGKYFKIRYINGNQNQSVFNLFCKLNVTVGEAILNATYDTITVFAGGSGLNIRELTTNDKISIPRLEQTLTTDAGVSALQCKITSMPPIVIPPITLADVNIRDSNGNDILSNSSGFLQTQIMNSSLTVNTISGFATSAAQTTAQASLNSLVTGTRIQASNGNNITVDGSNNLNTVVKNDVSISGIENKTVIDSFSKTLYRTVRWVLQISRGTDFVAEALDLVQDGIDFHLQEYEISSNTSNVLATVTLEENSGIINLCVTPTSTAVTARFYRTALKV